MPRSRRISFILLGVVAAVLLSELVARAVVHSSSEAIRWYDATAQAKVEQMDDLRHSEQLIELLDW